MSPHAMTDDSLNGSSTETVAPPAKMATFPYHASIPVGAPTKQETIEEMAGKWSDFHFAPIRESQVSRAMTRRYFADLDKCAFNHSYTTLLVR